MANRKKQLIRHFHNLVDKQLDKKISLKEKRELEGIKQALDKIDAPLYQAMVERYKEFDEEVEKLKRLNKRVKELIKARQK